MLGIEHQLSQRVHDGVPKRKPMMMTRVKITYSSCSEMKRPTQTAACGTATPQLTQASYLPRPVSHACRFPNTGTDTDVTQPPKSTVERGQRRENALLGVMVACGRQGGIGYGTGLCGLYVDGGWMRGQSTAVRRKPTERSTGRTKHNCFKTVSPRG